MKRFWSDSRAEVLMRISMIEFLDPLWRYGGMIRPFGFSYDDPRLVRHLDDEI